MTSPFDIDGRLDCRRPLQEEEKLDSSSCSLCFFRERYRWPISQESNLEMGVDEPIECPKYLRDSVFTAEMSLTRQLYNKRCS